MQLDPPRKAAHTLFSIIRTSYRPVADRNIRTDREALNS